METRPVKGHFLSVKQQFVSLYAHPDVHLPMPSHFRHPNVSFALLLDCHTNVFALDGVPRRAETQADILVPSPAALAHGSGLCCAALVAGEDVRLLLESALALDRQLGGHDCVRGTITGC